MYQISDATNLWVFFFGSDKFMGIMLDIYFVKQY